MEDAEVGAKWVLILLVLFGMVVLAMAGGGMGMAMMDSGGSCVPTGPGRTTCGDAGWDRVYGTFGLENPQTGQSSGW